MIETLTDPPEVVTVGEAVDALRMDTGDADGLLAGLLLAARELLEKDSGQLFGRRTILMTVDTPPLRCPGEIEVPVAPVLSISSIRHLADDGTETPYASDTYVLRKRNGTARIRPSRGGWAGRCGQLLVTMEAGADRLPEVARQAIIAQAGHWFDNPDGGPCDAYLALMERLRLTWL